MKCFKLDENGDISIVNNQIQMVDNKELTAQTVKTVLGTNKGEWFGNAEEGITFRNILGKHVATQTKKTTQSGDLSESQETALSNRLFNRLGGE